MGEQNGNNDPYYIQGGNAFAQETYVVDTGAQGGEEGAWMNNKDYAAVRALYAIYKERH